MALTAYALIAKWYLISSHLALPPARALVPVLLFHGFRFIGPAPPIRMSLPRGQGRSRPVTEVVHLMARCSGVE
jgi:hypothetical protein